MCKLIYVCTYDAGDVGLGGLAHVARRPPLPVHVATPRHIQGAEASDS